MPIYEFECRECKGIMEKIQSFDADAPLCCGVMMSRLPTFPAKIGVKGIHSQGYKEGYAKDYQRRLREAKS